MAEDAQIEQELASHLESTYGIGVAGIRPIPGGVLYHVDRHDGPSWVARPFIPGRPIERVEGEAEILRFLEEHDFPAERCAHAEPVSTMGDRHVLVTDFVEGKLPGRDGRAGVPVSTYKALADLLGRAHELPATSGAPARDAGSWHGEPLHEGLPSEDVAAGLSWLDEVDDRVAPHGRKVIDALRDRFSSVDVCAGLPTCFVHPDFGPVNVIKSPNGFVVVDWAGAGRGPRILSLANLLWATGGSHGGTPSGRVDAVVAGYAPHVGLEPEELERLAGIMRIRPLLFTCYYVRASVQAGYTPNGFEPWWPDHSETDSIAAMARDAFAAFQGART